MNKKVKWQPAYGPVGFLLKTSNSKGKHIYKNKKLMTLNTMSITDIVYLNN